MHTLTCCMFIAHCRQWGESSWWQNTRLPYGSMLAAGDADTFETILKWHLNMLPFARARSQVYFGFDSAFVSRLFVYAVLCIYIQVHCSRHCSSNPRS